MNAYGRMLIVFFSTKTKMQKTKSKNDQQHIILRSKQGLLALLFILFLSFSTIGFSLVSADRFQEKIDRLSAENESKEKSKDILNGEATNLSDAINRLQVQINAKQAAINEHQAEVERLKAEIAKAEKELAKQRSILGATIKAMYLEGDISTVEMLASSKNLSDFFDKQQYRDSVRDKVKSTLDKITQLKLDLNTKKQKTEKLIAEQKQLRNELLGQRGEKDLLLSLNENQRSNLDQKIRSNSKRIAELRAQQIAANARFSGGAVNVPDTSGYPWANHMGGSWTHAGSGSYPNDIDPWGMYKRQCVSYTAWKTWKTKGYMPYWGGHGDARNWPSNARAAGIPVNGTPKKGSIAISTSGTWGHAMYVESVHGNGTITVSQYNVSLTGKYSVATVSSSGLQFIHF